MSDVRPFCPPDTAPTWIRARPFRITHVELTVTIDLAARRVAGTVRHHVEPLRAGARERTLILDQHDLDIAGVTIDGVAASFSRGDGRIDIALPETLPSAYVVEVAFAASDPPKGLCFVAANATRGEAAMAWTQGAMEDHSWWFPCFDNPNNLSTYRIAIRHRSDIVGIANGRRESRLDHGDGWTTSTWIQDRPHVLYLVNVAVGDFVPVDDASGEVPITHWLPRGHEAKAPAVFRATAFAIRWLGAFIGVPFPWERYGHVVVHRFMWGGMENTTLTTITDRVLMDEAVQRADEVDADALIVHELVHQWFGDLLTMKAWSDIWLNESFATYLEVRGVAAWRAHHRGAVEADEIALELWANRGDYLDQEGERYRRPLVTNRYADAYELFDRVAYEKGSLILHALREWLGAERFAAALALYVERHRHDLVETADFRQAIEDATGEPCDWFFDQWTTRAGHPVIKVRAQHDAGRAQLIVDIEQKQASVDGKAAPDKVFRLPTAIAWRVGDALERRAVTLDQARQTLVFACGEAPAWIALDPDGALPAEWDEDAETAALAQRAADAALGAIARARAAVALGKKLMPAAIIERLRIVAADAATPRLVRHEAIAALAAGREALGRDALLRVWPTLTSPADRRVCAKAFGRFRGDATMAAKLIEWADADASPLVVGELLAARGALEHPGATPLIRARFARPSWNQRLRAGGARGMGESGEAAAIDDLLVLAADPREHDAVRAAALGGLGTLGARHLPARDRVRRAIERVVDDPVMAVRVAAMRALAGLGDPAGIGALSGRLGREPFGNVRRIIRESLDALGEAAAVTTATAALTKRVDELEQAKKTLEQRLEAVEKRLQ